MTNGSSGADYVRISNVCDHAQNNPHLHTMSLLRKSNVEAATLDPLSSTSLPKAFNNLAEEERKATIDIAHFTASENLPYTKHPEICALEAHHEQSLQEMLRKARQHNNNTTERQSNTTQLV